MDEISTILILSGLIKVLFGLGVFGGIMFHWY
jgi:hypothetical protein